MSVYKYKDGWRSQPEYRGVRAQSKTFIGKAEAKAKARAHHDTMMVELRQQFDKDAPSKRTLADAIEKYIQEASPKKKGARWEMLRLAAFSRHFPVHMRLTEIHPRDLRDWIDGRMDEVKPGTVLREIGVVSSVFTACVKDWYWLQENPMAKVRKPARPAHRKRIITLSETRKMLRGMGYVTGKAPESVTEYIAYDFLISLRTGMRASEITNLTWEDFHDTWVHLPKTKNGSERDVPLDKRTRAYFVVLMEGQNAHPVSIGIENRPIPISERTRDKRFREIRNRLGLAGFTFHDARHTAATRIGAKVGQPGRLTFPEFCRVFGWTDPRNAMIYVNPSAETLAGKL
jgi:integrase